MPDANTDPIRQHLPDGGPNYVETPQDIDHFTGTVAEPWNTASAVLFLVVAAAWIWALRGRYRQHAFLTMCLPILFTGGIGGVLFHGLRRHRAFLLMDVIPIYILGLSITIWLWIRLGPKLRHLLCLLAALVMLQMLAQFQLPRQWAISVSYAALGLMMLTPIALALVRTRFRHGGWVYTALTCFAIAWICRISDTVRPPLLPMGTHWLWHIFGALTTAALSMYLFRIEKQNLRQSAAKPL